MVYRQPSAPANVEREEPPFAPFPCVIDPIGEVIVRERVRVGALCVVYRGEHQGASIALKTARRAPIGRGSLCSSTFTGFETSLWGGETGLFDGPLERAVVDRLLAIEAEQIRHTNSRWNHSVYALGVWDPSVRSHRWGGGGEAEPASRSQLVLATPWWEGAPFAALAIGEQRALFPSMLPALWDALCASVHGDLSPSNVLIAADRARFALIDPCVSITSRRASDEDRALGWVDSTTLFTTNAAHYPIVPPWVSDLLARASSPEDRAPESLRECLDAYATVAAFRDAAVRASSVARRARPDCADLLALGLWYARVLGGEEAIGRLEIPARPAWCGTCGEHGRSAADALLAARAAVDRFSSLDARALGSEVTDAEATLARALLVGAIDGRASLRKLATDALLATSTRA